MDVRLPNELHSGIQQLLHAQSRSELSNRSARISEGYRRYEPSSVSIIDSVDVMAYSLSRLPATYAAVVTVLESLAAAYPDFRPRTVLDAGAGPGTATWAACTVWPSIESASLIDHSAAFLNVARQLSAMSSNPALHSADFELGELTSYLPGKTFDLVIASYAMTELADARPAGSSLFASTAGVLVVIEPGRPRDYQRILEVRGDVLAAGGRVLAPCPHSDECPLPTGDWCHFSARLPRTRDHMQAKNAVAPFEDEKFSYIAMCHKDSGLGRGPFGLVLAPPVKTKHSTALKICTQRGLVHRTVQSRDKAAYNGIKKIGWGDTLDVLID